MKLFARKLFRTSRSGQRGQSIVEFILVLFLGLMLTRLVYFNPDFGLSASLQNMMLRLGGLLENNLKAGTGSKVGSAAGEASTNKFMGTTAWKN